MHLVLMSCRSPSTAIVVVVDTDYTVPDQLASVVVTSRGASEMPSESHTFTLRRSGEIPFSFTVLPREGTAGVARIRVAGLNGMGGERVAREFQTNFVAGRTLLTTLFLAMRCEAPAGTCPAGETCSERGCVPVRTAPETLPEAIPGRELGRIDGAMRDGVNDLVIEGDGASDGELDAADTLDPDSTVGDTPMGTPDAPVEEGLDAGGDGTTRDADAPEATCDAGFAWSGGACVPVAAPRPVAPLSTATVTSQRPTLRWALASGTDGARVQICRDRGCATVEQTLEVAGARAVPTTALAPGVHFWRLFGRAGSAVGAAAGPVWEFWVGHRTAPVDTSWGAHLDLNGDGFSEVVVGTRGRLEIYPGSATGPSSTLHTTRTIAGEGNVLACAGDVNGDGYADLLVADPNDNMEDGAVEMYHGSAAGLEVTPRRRLVSPVTRGRFGSVAAGIGDVNGDGFGDIAVGTYYPVRELYVYYGSSGGTPARPSKTLLNPGPSPTSDEFPAHLASAGDINGDGFADLAVSGNVGSGTRTGRIYVYSGGALGLPDRPTATVTTPTGYFTSFLRAGDLNGDGFADFAAVNSQQRMLVYHGGMSGLPAAPDATVTAPPGMLLLSVVAAGDVDGDGFSDVAMRSDRSAGSGLTGAGEWQVYAYAGSAASLAATPGFTIPAPDNSEIFGASIAMDTDVNGDGFSDIVIGAPPWSAARPPGLGHVRAYFGGPMGPWRIPDVVLERPEMGFYNFGAFLALLGGWGGLEGRRVACREFGGPTQERSSCLN